MASRVLRRAVGINNKSSAANAATIGGCQTSVSLSRARRPGLFQPNARRFVGAFNATPGQAGLPAEFKHINKRRKRNLQGFP